MNIRKAIVALLLIMVVCNVLGQQDQKFAFYNIVEFDTKTNLPKTPIPFNEPFRLKINLEEGQEVAKAYLFGLKLNSKGRYDFVNSGRGADLYYKQEGTVLEVLVPNLRANKSFFIAIDIYPTKELLNELLAINTGYASTGNFATLSQSFGKIHKKYGEVKINGKQLRIDNFMAKDTFYEKFYDTALKKYYDSLGQLQLEAVSVFPQHFGCYLNVLENVCSEVCKNLKFAESINFYKSLGNENCFNKYQAGLLDAKCFSNDEGKADDVFNIATRLERVGKLKGFLDSATHFLSEKELKFNCKKIKVECCDSISISEAIKGFTELRKGVSNNHTLLLQLYNTIVEKINKDSLLSMRKVLTGNTYSGDEIDRGRWLFLDVGLGGIGANTNRGQREWVLPQFSYSASIYLRRRSKEASKYGFDLTTRNRRVIGRMIKDPGNRLKQIINYPSIWERTCINLGVTVGSISGKNFSNGNNNYSLMLGGSFHLVHGLKIGGGTVYINRTPANPLISDSEKIFAGYFSVLIDIDIIKAFGKVSEILLK